MIAAFNRKSSIGISHRNHEFPGVSRGEVVQHIVNFGFFLSDENRDSRAIFHTGRLSMDLRLFSFELEQLSDRIKYG